MSTTQYTRTDGDLVVATGVKSGKLISSLYPKRYVCCKAVSLKCYLLTNYLLITPLPKIRNHLYALLRTPNSHQGN